MDLGEAHFASASIGGRVGLYEPIHGSAAPDIAGLGIANHCDHFKCFDDASFCPWREQRPIEFENAIKKVLKDGYRTKDLANYGAKEVRSTTQIGSIIADYVSKQ